MARARSIKPGIFKNEILGVADPLYTLAFEGLWVLADREGRLEDRPLRIKAETFPYRDGIDMEFILNWLESNQFIKRYKVEGKPYIAIISFLKHQNPHKNEVESEIPPVESADIPNKSEQVQIKSEPLGLTPDSLNLTPLTLNPVTDSLIPPIGASDVFADFWAAYPKKVGRGDAEKSWKKIKQPSKTFALIAAALLWQTESEQWSKDNGQYIPNPATYLNQQRWLDEPPAQAPPQTMTPVGQRATLAANRWLESQGVEKTA